MNGVAKRCSQLLSLRPGARVALAIGDEALGAALQSLFGSVGAVVVDADATAGVVGLDEPLAHSVPADVRALIERVAPGGDVVIVLRGAGEGRHPNQLAAHIGPMLDLEGVTVEPAPGDGALLLKGTRRARLSGAKVKRLRGLGHHIEPSVLVGRAGLSPETVAAARLAVERHGLIKIKLTPQCELDKGAAAVEVAWATGSKLVQRVGKIALIYRPDVKLDPPVPRRRRG